MTRASLAALFSSTTLIALCGLGPLAACGGGTASGVHDTDGGGTGNGSSGSSGTSGGTGDGGTGGSDASKSDGGKTITHAPAIHRATAAACSHDRGPGDFDTQNMNAMCASDAECTSGDNGRCLATKVAARTNYCSYDACFTDADCGNSKVCTCREFASDANRCDPGNCKVDADCGAGGYCSPSADPDKTNFGSTGWWCHTKLDECVDDTDCVAQSGAKCVYDPAVSHFTCSSKMFLPP